jgi:hypothetical protein
MRLPGPSHAAFALRHVLLNLTHHLSMESLRSLRSYQSQLIFYSNFHLRNLRWVHLTESLSLLNFVQERGQSAVASPLVVHAMIKQIFEAIGSCHELWVVVQSVPQLYNCEG